MRSFKMDNSTKRLFEVVDDDLDEVLSQAVGDLLMVHTELTGVPDHDVNELLCQFIAEVRKDGGERYPAKTLHELVSSLKKYFYSTKGHCFTQVEHEVII